MTAEVVEFKAGDADQAACIELLEKALEMARAGKIRDVAVVAAVRDEDGPQFWHGYYGDGAYATLLAGVSALTFDLHYRRYKEAET